MPKSKKVKKSTISNITKETEKGNKSYIIYILIGFLLIAVYFLWNMSSKMKKLEEKVGETTVVPKKQENIQPTTVVQAVLKVADNDPSLGSKSAKVTAIIFSDFLCPFCAALSGDSKSMVDSMKSRFGNDWEAPLPNIIKEYVDSGKVRIVWKDAPYHGDQAVQVHAAARCANEQGKFWDFHNLIFSKYGEQQGEYNKDNLKKLGVDLKLDANKYNSCIDSDRYIQTMRDSISYAQGVGANGTPATFINGKLVSGAQPYSQFKTIIDEELKK
jgi:protein-disulfide isomerase